MKDTHQVALAGFGRRPSNPAWEMSRRIGKRGGDLIGTTLLADPPDDGPLPYRERMTGVDPQSIAEFRKYDIPFATEPAAGFTFPPQVHRG